MLFVKVVGKSIVFLLCGIFFREYLGKIDKFFTDIFFRLVLICWS